MGFTPWLSPVGLCVVLVWILWGSPLKAQAREVRIDVLSYRPKMHTAAQFDALARTLSQRIPEHRFRVVPCTYEELAEDLLHQRVDVLLTNPSNYLALRARFDLTAPLATMITEEPVLLPHFGGVIVVRADRQDLQTLADLAHQRIVAVDRSSLGAFQAQAYELQKAGLLFSVDYTVQFLDMPHDGTVHAVLDGSADAGFVRTGVLEDMARQGQIRLDALRVIRSPDAASADQFPLRISTPLYPEWPLVARNGLEEHLLRQVVTTVLTMPSSMGPMHPAFVVPQRYDDVEHLVRSLRLPPFDQSPEFNLQDIWHRYPWPISLIAVLLLLVTLLSIWLVRANQLLQLKRARIEKEVEQRRTLLETMDEGVYELDANGLCSVVNRAALQMLGHAQEDLLGQDMHVLIHHHHEDGAAHRLEDCPILNTRQDGIARHVEDWFWRKDGTGFPVALRTSAHLGPKGARSVVVVFHDISEQRRQEQHIRHLAYHDALTGLPNRTLFMDRLEQSLRLSRRIGDRIALLFIDLDRFKPVNDQHGHQAGDQLLVQVAHRIQSCLRQSDTAARVGGDEFIALLHGLRDTEDAEAIAHKIRSALQTPFELGDDGLVVQISASIGIALDLDGLLDADSLQAQADQAMYQSKESGGDRVTLS